jgi:hypothetical protein
MGKFKESKSEPSVEVAAFSPKEDELVEVQALRQVNTTLYGNIREGQRGKVSALMAKQLEEQGEVKIVK